MLGQGSGQIPGREQIYPAIANGAMRDFMVQTISLLLLADGPVSMMK
jgi:hypothetical protein